MHDPLVELTNAGRNYASRLTGSERRQFLEYISRFATHNVVKPEHAENLRRNAGEVLHIMGIKKLVPVLPSYPIVRGWIACTSEQLSEYARAHVAYVQSSAGKTFRRLPADGVDDR